MVRVSEIFFIITENHWHGFFSVHEYHFMKSRISLKRTLDRFYTTYDFQKRLRHDPIEFPRRYTKAEDIEIAGFIASCFAYGKVELFRPVVERILRPGGRHPALFFRNFSLKLDAKRMRGIHYRFHKEKDILGLLCLLSKVLKQHGSLKNLFLKHYTDEQEDVGHALGCFSDNLADAGISPDAVKNSRPAALAFFPSPRTGSACKRLNLFLRWMVRDRDIDLGIWDEIPPSKLIIPLDTHIARIARCLGLTQRASSGWNTAKEITRSLKELDPQDPLKYDFALCHHGISGLCRGEKFRDTCKSCALG
jgi:uncharacterized protein (TIGR02757 family)